MGGRLQRIAKKWGLSFDETQQLLSDDLDRISYVLGIYKALRIIFPTEDQANAWPGKPNEAFEGRTALEIMLSGDLSRVRRYLDAQLES